MRPTVLLAFALLTGCAIQPLDEPAVTSGAAFIDVAADWGLGDVAAKRASWGDLNGDGWLDCIIDGHRVFISRPGTETSRTFVEFTEESGINRHLHEVSEQARATLVVLGDVDNDGDLDLYSAYQQRVEYWRPDPENPRLPLRDEDGELVSRHPDDGLRSAILLNDGSGRFARVADSGVGQHAETTTCATFLDYDLDGCLDLFVGNGYRSYGWSVEAYPDRLFRGDGTGKFREVTKAAGLLTDAELGTRFSSRPTYGVASGDWNGDGYPDLFVCVYGRQWNYLWENRGDGTFRDVAARTGFDGDDDRRGTYPSWVGRRQELPFRSNGNTFDCALGDFDDDGDLDVFTGEITHAWAGPSSDRSQLLENTGAGFRRRDDVGVDREHAVERWNQGDIHVSWVDADGDGRLDLLLGSSDYPDDQRLRLFRQTDRRRFEDVTAAVGLDWEGSAGMSIGDCDRDGDPDVLVGRSLFRLSKEKREELGTAPALWRNVGASARQWLAIRIRGRGEGWTNRSGIGCRVTVIRDGTRQTLEMRAGEGHSGHQNPPELYFGCGDDEVVDAVEIRWARPGLPVERFESVRVGRVTIVEGERGRIVRRR